MNESNGRPVSGTATKGKDPVCDFEAEREIQGVKEAALTWIVSVSEYNPYTRHL